MEGTNRTTYGTQLTKIINSDQNYLISKNVRIDLDDAPKD